MEQRLVPYLNYEDAASAIDFLVRAFGFEAIERYDMPDGRVGHAELRFGRDTLMLASAYEDFGFVGVPKLTGVPSQILCYVDDLDAHLIHARAEGATIATEVLEEHGQRSYRALDPEGHRWMFVERSVSG